MTSLTRMAVLTGFAGAVDLTSLLPLRRCFLCQQCQPGQQGLVVIRMDIMPELFDKHALEQRKKYSHWVDSADAVVVANAMLIIIGRALNMLKSPIEAQGQAFEETGGFNERLTAKRIEAREKERAPSPDCPQCGKPMRRRKSAKGDFWGCSAFPDCKGTRSA